MRSTVLPSGVIVQHNSDYSGDLRLVFPGGAGVERYGARGASVEISYETLEEIVFEKRRGDVIALLEDLDLERVRGALRLISAGFRR